MADTPYFLKNGGEMGSLMRAFDWSSTPVGEPSGWPQVLKTTISTILSSRFPMFLWWGDDLIQFYNDAYRPSLGENGKHPKALGQKAVDCWAEIWDVIYPLILQVKTTGDPTWSENQHIPIFRNGRLEDVYWTFGYSAIYEEDGQIGGVLVICNETTERVLSEIKYSQSQRNILDLFEQAPVGIATIVEKDLTFTMANAFYGELVGRSPIDIVGKPLLEALPEIGGQGFDQLLRNVIETGHPYIANEVSVKLLRNGGLENVYVDLTYQPKFDPDGTKGVLVVATDVTQQVRSRLKVEQSEAQMRAIIAAAPAGIGLFVGRDLIVEMPNQTFIDIVGKGWDIVGKPLREAMPELLTEGQPFLKILDDVYTTGVMFQSFGSQVKIIQHGVMTYNYYNITYTPIRNENGDVYAILDIAIDVTDSVLSMKKAEDAERALLGAIELAELATWQYDIHTSTFHYSPRFLDWLGMAENMPGQTESPSPREFQSYVMDGIQDAIRSEGTGIYRAEHPIVNRQTGQERIIQAQAHLVRDIDGVPQYLTGTAEDVTQERVLQKHLEWQVRERTQKLVEANAELQKSNSELERFAYIASHDLQEPLRKISTFASMFKAHSGSSDAKSIQYIERIQSSAERMSNLVRDILGFSRLSHSHDVFVRMDLTEIFRKILSDFELLVEQKGAVIQVRDLPVMDVIPLQIEQLFGNLISNSLKYSRPDIAPEISITAAILSDKEKERLGINLKKSYSRLEFRDNGIGFSPEYAEQIFQIFQRLHGKTDYEGTGIGLAMCRRIAQNHTGLIFASSEQGKGAVFTVVLPFTQ